MSFCQRRKIVNYTCVREYFFVRFGETEDIQRLIPIVVQGFIGMKFHLDTPEVGKH